MQAEQKQRRNRRLPREVRERQILTAAVDVFAARGFHAASMDEISEVAGISKPMIYAYLGAKEELFEACIRKEAERLIEAIGESVVPGSSPEQQLWQGLRGFFAYVNDNRAGWTVLHRQAASLQEPFISEFLEWRQRATGMIAELLARATERSPQPRRPEQMLPFAAALVGAGESLVEWWFDNPEHTPDGLARRLMNMVWMGFGNLVEGKSWSPDAE
ncbi:TetR/AcrR family transcriptional regulator [Saccharopolyspora rectivirgula]|mgnify:FL=1|jgi:AcrR family transcriptional regulator|uniref:TetR family transcriptional regulator n=1 Tax=Saccharopolyspora rectivirgula TaxID=28042 RepID=A0A073B3Z1_9PSEU|nr:TetR/AcrR family transcriptional regulator [Saccharopolyspora rectivirgula]KEI46012.1 TetR family transcriptional regulator [Saccharopolyspora rectivirgula]